MFLFFLVRIHKEKYTTLILILERLYGITLVMSYTDKRSKRKGRNHQGIVKVRALIQNYIRILLRYQMLMNYALFIGYYSRVTYAICLSVSGSQALGGPTAGRSAGGHSVLKIYRFFLWKWKFYCPIYFWKQFLNSVWLSLYKRFRYLSTVRWS